MDYIMLFLRWFIGYILVSSAYHHTIDRMGFRESVEKYDILPKYFITSFTYIILFTKYSIGFLLISGVFLKISYLLAFLLILLFTIALLINLLKNKDNIDCGCGGVLGNHKVNWNLIIKNSCLLGIIVLLYLNNNTYGSLFEIISGNYDSLSIHMFSIIISLFSFFNFQLTFSEITKIQNKLESFLE